MPRSFGLGRAGAPLAWAWARMARARRSGFAGAPWRVRRLARPVVSVGNLAVGGRAKTPVTAHVARLLAEAGERVAILSRGYARGRPEDGVTVVSDGAGVCAGLACAGDEPLMLAESLPGVAVLVCEDRYLAGCLAEARLGCTVHVLDDGFQHLALHRDVDLLVATPDDLQGERVLPAGRLREPVDAARAASALLVLDGRAASVAETAGRLGIGRVFEVVRTLGEPVPVGPRDPAAAPPARPARVLAVAGLAEPARFFTDLLVAGWQVIEAVPFPDHHAYTPRDAQRLAARARTSGAELVLTTEKDAVRWRALGALPVPVAAVPLRVDVQPAHAFGPWLTGAVAGAAAARATGRGEVSA